MPAQLTDQQRHEMIARLRALPDELERAVSGLTTEQLMTHYLPKEWNAAQNVHHVADAHITSYSRMKIMLTDEGLRVFPDLCQVESGPDR